MVEELKWISYPRRAGPMGELVAGAPDEAPAWKSLLRKGLQIAAVGGSIAAACYYGSSLLEKLKKRGARGEASSSEAIRTYVAQVHTTWPCICVGVGSLLLYRVT